MSPIFGLSVIVHLAIILAIKLIKPINLSLWSKISLRCSALPGIFSACISAFFIAAIGFAVLFQAAFSINSSIKNGYNARLVKAIIYDNSARAETIFGRVIHYERDDGLDRVDDPIEFFESPLEFSSDESINTAWVENFLQI